jgi:hypothetical protein
VYSVSNPNAMPYEVVKASLMDFNRLVLVNNPRCAIVPWIQDFSLGVHYGPDMVRKQIQAARDVGLNGYYLWNAGATYQGAALDVRESSQNAPGKLIYSINKPGNISEGTDDAAKAKIYIEAYLAWKDGGKQGLFVSPLDPAANTGTTPGGTTPAQSPTSGQTPATPSTPAATPTATATATSQP